MIVARSRQDYAWVMAQRPNVGQEELARLAQELGKQGYDVSTVRVVPQRWPDPGHPVQWGR